MAEISPIDRGTVHKICSGQVVLNLATAVKELVENSLDAGSTNIEVKLVEYGSKSIQVLDNGSGVEEHNFQALTLKHHTSKIRDFDDVIGVETFGFRGEALSSLCALCSLSITTRHSTSCMATEISYDRNGKIESTKRVPGNVGTSVVLRDLFCTMPVRMKEFHRHLKREFQKMCNVLTGYCLISIGVRISCVNFVKDRRSPVVLTRGRDTVKENISDVFGPKQLQNLKEVEFEDGNLKLKGFTSSCSHGEGRSSSDRQYLFVNNRPCDSSKVLRTVNEIYKTYNRHQYPFLLLNVVTERTTVDVNVTPDKRRIFLENERKLLDSLHTAFVGIFDTEPSTFVCNSSQNRLENTFPVSESKRRKIGNDERDLSSFEKLKRSISIWKSEEKKEADVSIASFFVPASKSFEMSNSVEISEEREPLVEKEEEEILPKNVIIEDIAATNSMKEVSCKLNDEPLINKGDSTLLKNVIIEDIFVNDSKCLKPLIDKVDSTLAKNVMIDEESRSKDIKPSFDSTFNDIVVIDNDNGFDKKSRKTQIIKFDLDSLTRTSGDRNSDNSVERFRRFYAKIDPKDNESAEEELKKEIKKKSFTEMEVLGQFNLGFIIGKLNDDLFIIDQHATDEKYNFERLQRDVQLSSQRMMIPQRLELTSVSESVLIDNIEIFRKNGFEFDIDEDGSDVGSRVSLTKVPMSKNWNFGKSDVEELIFMLNDEEQPTTISHLRPSRVRAMFASRACRTSIMIGTALSRKDMRKLLDHMADMEQPWNCPHGRPTMRHLINLNMIG